MLKRHKLWLTKRELSFIKQVIKKEAGMTMTFIKKIAPVNPKEVVNLFDLGYLGAEKDFQQQLSSLPYRKKRNQEISKEERYYNKDPAKRRIVIEHTIYRYQKKKDIITKTLLKEE